MVEKRREKSSGLQFSNRLNLLLSLQEITGESRIHFIGDWMLYLVRTNLAIEIEMEPEIWQLVANWL